MPPKKASQVYLVVDQFTTTNTVRIIEAYTTGELAQQAAEDLTNEGDYGKLDVISVEVKSTAGVHKPAKAASRSKASKKVKAEDHDEEDDEMDVDEEQAEVNDKKAATSSKRKQVVEGDANALSGLKLLFTGTFTMDRKTCEATAVKAGAAIVSSMKQADYIVLGTKPGPKKVTEIEDNGYETWDEETFLSKVQGSSDGVSDAKKKKKGSK